MKAVNPLLGTESIYHVIEAEQKRQLLRSPERGLRNLDKILARTKSGNGPLKMKELKFSTKVGFLPNIQNIPAPSPMLSYLPDILPALLLCLCIGCTLY